MRRSVALVVALALSMLGMASMQAAQAVGPVRNVVEPALTEQLAAAKPTDQITVFVRGTSLTAARTAVFTAGLKPVTEWHSIDVVVGTGNPAAVRAVTKAAGVEYVEVDKPIVYFLDTSHLATRAEEARNLPQLQQGGLPYDGAGVTIAVNDSGVDGSHEMFTEAGTSKVRLNLRELCAEVACSGLTVNMAKTPVNDSDTLGASGHGTHVAGIAAGYERTTANGRVVRGSAPGATLAAYGMGVGLNILAANAGLQFFLDNVNNPCLDGSCPPLRVINNSWGSTGEFNPNSATSLLSDALVDAGVTVIFAAGNGTVTGGGGDGTTNLVNPYAQNPKPGVIGVANYDDLETGTPNGTLDSSSSRGERGRPETYPDISAPGSLIVSACRQHLPICRSYADTRDIGDLNYASIGGTSMAAPYIAGVVAMMKQANPSLTPAQMEDILEDTAYKFGDPASYEADPRNADDTTSFDKGHGLVDVTSALGSALNVTVPPPPPPPPAPTTETKPYVGAYGDAAVNCALGTGGACFDIAGAKPGARITINDDHAEWAVGAQYSFRDAAGEETAGGFMCGQTHQPVPAGTAQLLIFLAEATGAAACFLADGSASPGAATTGTITVDWIPVPVTSTDVKKYVGPPGDAVANCAGIGGTCFDIRHAATHADVLITDDYADGDVAAFYQFRNAADVAIESDFICGSASLPIPAGAVTLRFFMQTATGPLTCTESLGAALAGSIAVTWS